MAVIVFDVAAFRAMFTAFSSESAFPEAVYRMVKRRLDKVAQYLLQQ